MQQGIYAQMKEIVFDGLLIRSQDGAWLSKQHQDSSPSLCFTSTEPTTTLDLHYYFSAGRDPVPGDILKTRLSTSEFNDYDSALTIEHSSHKEGIVVAMDTTMCGRLILSGLPNIQECGETTCIYASFKRYNRGLTGFVSRTGMRRLLDPKE